MASFFVQQLDLLSLTSPWDFRSMRDKAPSCAKQFSPRERPRRCNSDNYNDNDDDDDRRAKGLARKSSLHRLYNEGSLRGERKLNRRAWDTRELRERTYDGSSFLPSSSTANSSKPRQ